MATLCRYSHHDDGSGDVMYGDIFTNSIKEGSKMEKLIQLKLPCNFEKAGEPTIELDGADIRIIFRDEISSPFMQIFLGDYIAYKWQMAKTLSEQEKVGECYQVLNSNWLQEHINKDVVNPEDEYYHYKLIFKDSQLEVLALGINTGFICSK